MSRPARHPDTDPDLDAAAHFAALDIALSRGDYAATAKAQQTLTELGWDIRHRHRKPRPEADGRGVGR
jgi:hypothetical protein